MKGILVYILILVFLVSVFIIVGAPSFVINTFMGDEISAEEIATEEYVEITTEATTSSEIIISFAGDATLGTYIGQYGGGRFDEVYSKNGAEYFLKNVKHIFENDHMTVLNLEGPLTNSKNIVKKQFSISGLPEYVNILTSGSVEAVNLANNHTMDRGEAGYQETQNILTENSVGYFGYNDIYYKEIKGVKFALIGALGFQDTADVRANIKKLIDEAKSQSDIVIVEFHWGIESQNYSYSVQENLGRFAIDNGVDLVVGSHTHCIQGIETYKGKNIVYSMGNFSFGANKNPRDKACFIFRQYYDSITKEATGSKVIPCNITSDTSRNNYQPTPLEGQEAQNIIDRLVEYSSRYETPYNFQA